MSRRTVANDKAQIQEDRVLDIVEKLGSATVEQLMEALNLRGPANRRAVQRRLNSLHQQACLGRYLDTGSPHRRYIYYSDELLITTKVRIKNGDKRPTIIEKNIASAYALKRKRARRYMASGFTGAIIRRALKGQLSKDRFGLLYSHEPREVAQIAREHLQARSNVELAYEGDIYWTLTFTAFQYMERKLPAKYIDLHVSIDIEGLLRDLTSLILSKYGEAWEKSQPR